jgi:hypothetical protein
MMKNKVLLIFSICICLIGLSLSGRTEKQGNAQNLQADSLLIVKHLTTITKTDGYRNYNYHHIGNTMETLDISKMMKVIDAVFHTLVNM